MGANCILENNGSNGFNLAFCPKFRVLEQTIADLMQENARLEKFVQSAPEHSQVKTQAISEFAAWSG